MTRDRLDPGEWFSLPDHALSADLGDGLMAVIGVQPDGTTWPWLLVPGGDGAAPRSFPAHENEGPLPARFRLIPSSREERWLSKTCPTCHAPPGTECSYRGRRDGRLHRARADQAMP